MIKLFKAKRDGNGYIPYDSPFSFDSMAEAEDFARNACVGRYFAHEVLLDGGLSDPVFIDPFKKPPLDQQIRDAEQQQEKQQDLYLQSLNDTLTMCDLVIQNRQVLGTEKVQQAIKLKAETEERIQKRVRVLEKERS